jgi:hypothetical protein
MILQFTLLHRTAPSDALSSLHFTLPGLRGSRPVLSCENGRKGVSVNFLHPTDRSQNFGRTKLLSDYETVGRA